MVIYRLITAYLLLRVNLDKKMHACTLDKHQNQSTRTSEKEQASKLKRTGQASIRSPKLNTKYVQKYKSNSYLT